MTATTIRKTALTAAEKFWYVLGNVPLGAAYFAKIPVKKALADFGLATLTSAEQFWYVLMCVGFGAGYFAKLPAAKALSELPQISGTATHRQIGMPQQQQLPEASQARSADSTSPAITTHDERDQVSRPERGRSTQP